MERVNEGTTSHHPFTLVDKNSAPVVPESLRYQLMASSKVLLLPWTSLPPNAVEVVVPAELNMIGTVGKKRYLAIEATHNGSEKITGEIQYQIHDLAAFT